MGRVRLLLLVAAAGAAAFFAVRLSEPRTVGESIDHWSHAYHVDPHLVRAVAWMESGYRDDAVSSTGARGVMQVEPGTWTFTEHLLGRRVAHTRDGNIRIGVAYLRYLLHEFHGDRRLALAAYYEGPHAVHRFGVYRSAERYAASVLALSRRV